MDTGIEQLKEIIQNYLADKPAAFVYVFGSVAKGLADRNSDIDIAVGFSKEMDYNDALLDNLAGEIATKLQIPLEKVDIKVFSQLPLSLRFRVIRDGILVYIKDIRTHRLQTIRTMQAYEDEKPFFDRVNQAFFKHYASKTL